MRNAFHQAAVAHKNVGVVVHNLVLGSVELRGQHALGQGHAHGGGNALPQRAGGHFNTQMRLVFGMPGGFCSPLAEIAYFFHGDVVAREVQQGVEQHGRMPVGEYKAVAVEPQGIGRIMPETVPPEGFGHIGHAEGRTGVAGAGFLNSVHGKGADGVGALSAGGHDHSSIFAWDE